MIKELKIEMDLPQRISSFNYDDSFNKPKINGVILEGDKTPKDLNMKTSQILNDGENGSSKYATENYVDVNGGKIDNIKVNGVTQSIINKEVDINVPTNVSELNNDSEYVNVTQLDNEARVLEQKITENTNNINTKFDETKANVNVVTNASNDISNDSYNIKLSKKNLSSEVTSEESLLLNLANEQSAGMMSFEDFKQIRKNTQDIEQLKNITTRLLYTASTNPTVPEIDAFAKSKGYLPPFKGVAVVVDKTFHIWHYYEGGVGWTDDGMDTVQQFTNEFSGTIKGSNIDGKVFAENDGTGSIVGWDELKTRTTNLETGLGDTNTNVESNKKEIDGHTTKITNLETELSQTNSKIEENVVSINNLNAKVKVIDLGAIKPGLEFSLTTEQVNDLYNEYPPTIQVTISNYTTNLYRYDRTINDLYYSNVMFYEGRKYFIRFHVNKGTNKAMIISDDEPRIPKPDKTTDVGKSVVVDANGDFELKKIEGGGTGSGVKILVNGIESEQINFIEVATPELPPIPPEPPVPINKIYGVDKVGSSNPDLRAFRTDDAVGMGYSLVGNTYNSDFDNAYPWSDITEVTDTKGNKFVRIPKFYHKFTANEDGTYKVQITKEKIDDTWLTCFINAGKEIPYMDIGKYEASGSGTLKSVSGVAPLVGTNIVNFRTYAKSNGTGYHQFDIWNYEVIKLLFLVEFATTNSQKIMYGNCNSSTSINTGSCDSIGINKTGSNGSITSSVGITYRGIENPWGNIRKWCDGINFNSSNVYICDDISKYQSDKYDIQYKSVGTRCDNGTNNTKTMSPCTSNYPQLMIPTDANGSNSTYYCDYYWTGGNVLDLGGNWNRGGSGGLWYWGGSYDSSRSEVYLGGRLCYKPISEV